MILEAASITYRFEDGTQLAFPKLSIASGQHTLILGPSGCGKTTWLHLLSGLRSVSGSEIRIDGQDITRMSVGGLDAFRGSKVGMIFQTPHFVRSVSVGDNLALAQTLSGHKRDNTAIIETLDRLGLADKVDKKTDRLSIGEQQRVAIARALVNRPAIIFADEPTSALDDRNTEAVINLLIEQAELHSATLVVVTHDQRIKPLINHHVQL